MTDGQIITRRDGRTFLVGIDRPSRKNSLTPEMMVALGEALTAFDDDPEAWVCILYGEGDNFTAGLDLPAFAPYLTGVAPPAGGGEDRRAAAAG